MDLVTATSTGLRTVQSVGPATAAAIVEPIYVDAGGHEVTVSGSEAAAAVCGGEVPAALAVAPPPPPGLQLTTITVAVPASSLSPEDDDAAAVTAVAASGIPTTALQLAASVGGGGTCHPPTPLPTVPLPLATASAAVSGGMKWKQVESGIDASSPGTPLPQPLTPNSSKEITKSQMGGLVRCTRY